MNIIISHSSGTPIYEQIVAQIKEQILSGALAEGVLLPSMRTLAAELRISLITTKRAYEELEKAGLIQTVAGKGCYVQGKKQEMLREEYRKTMEYHLQEAIACAKKSGVTRQELLEVLMMLEE